MRVFVAVMLPDAVRASLERQIDALRLAAPGLTWERPERWHVTLTFLGEVDEHLVDDLRPRLERAASRTERFTLAAEGLGRFGDRVLYLKVGGDRPQLRRLAERTTAASLRAGANLDEGRFRPHVTLARSRRGAQLRPLVESGQQIAVPDWQVNEFVMVNSILGTDRRYEILGRHALGSGV